MDAYRESMNSCHFHETTSAVVLTLFVCATQYDLTKWTILGLHEVSDSDVFQKITRFVRSLAMHSRLRQVRVRVRTHR